jgi:hypothetical protein
MLCLRSSGTTRHGVGALATLHLILTKNSTNRVAMPTSKLLTVTSALCSLFKRSGSFAFKCHRRVGFGFAA